MTFASLPAANAIVISTNPLQTPSAFSQWSGLDYEGQPISNLIVDSTVGISNFGVYGKVSGSATLNWLIFDMSSPSKALDYGQFAPVWSSGPVGATVNTTGTWYDSPTVNATLLAGHTYSLGVWATGGFSYGYNTSGATISQDNLQIPLLLGGTAFASDGSGIIARDPFLDVEGRNASLQVSYTLGPLGAPLGDVPAAPVPEPAEWTMLLAGLMVVSFVANRQRKHRI